MFHITGAAVTIAGLTITNGRADSGGGIYTGPGALTVSNCTLSGNSATNGGGIYNDSSTGSATLTVNSSAISSNLASAIGGGICNNSASSGTGTVQIVNSTLSGNSAGYGGGGIRNSGSLTISASTLSGNVSSGLGGGIDTGGNAIVSATTLSGNRAASEGGGINNHGGSLTVRASTFSGNSSTSRGGGIRNKGFVHIGSTILNADCCSGNIHNVPGAVISDGYNLASDDGEGYLTGTADQINTDPMLGPLQDNGGPTFTHALLPGSPAIDQGYSFGLTADQRGLPRTLDLAGIPNASGGDGTDIGAVESQDASLRLLNLGQMSNQFGFNLIGPFSTVVVEASTNLVNWTALATNTLGAGPLHFSDPGSTNLPQRFYRAEIIP